MSDVFVKIFSTSVMIVIILFTFLLVKDGANLPIMLTVMIASSDCVGGMVTHYIFSLATSLHILSKEIISISIKQSRGYAHDSCFWKSMKPLKVGLGNICTFETREFLLYIWGGVIISKITDLLIAF